MPKTTDDSPVSAVIASRRGSLRYWPADLVAAVVPQICAWMQDVTSRSVYFSTVQMEKEFDMPFLVARRIARDLEKEGLLLFCGRMGWSWKSGATGQAVTLGTLLRYAEAHVVQDATAEKGRRSLTLERLTPSQLKDVKTVVNLVARNAGDGDQEKVTGRWFAYDTSEKAWALEAHVARWSDEEHRSNFHRKGGTGVWHARQNSGRSKALGAVANLLDLAATHQLIPRTGAPEAGVRNSAPQWKPVIAKWTRRILDQDPTGKSVIKIGLRVLTVYATRRRELSFRTTDWLAVRAEIEERYETLVNDPKAAVKHVRTARNQRDSARYTWRRILALLRSSLDRPSGPSDRVRIAISEEYNWPTVQDTRRSLVPDGAMRDAAAYATGKTLSPKTRRSIGAVGAPRSQFDYEAQWTSRGGEYVKSFVEGEHGIADFITWSTAPVDWLERKNFPARAFINPTPEMLPGIRRATSSDRQPYVLGCESLISRLQMFSRLAGWAHEHGALTEEMLERRYDFVGQDNLASLCDLPLVLAYSEWVREESSDDEEGDEEDIAVPHVVAELAKNLAKLASPYLEGRALKRAESLQAVGMVAAAEEARAESRRLREEGRKLKAWGWKHARRENTHKDIVAIAEAWAGSNHRSGWLKLADLVDILLRKAEAEVGLTLQEQLESMRSASTATPEQRAKLLAWQSHEWASLMRSAMLVNLVRKVPLRARALSELRLEWWEATVDGIRVEPWRRDASIMLRVPGKAMKTKKRDYYAPYIRPECVGELDFEVGAQRDLLEAFLRPEGARAFSLTQWESEKSRRDDGRAPGAPVALGIIESPYVLPSSATFGNAGKGSSRETRLQTGLKWRSSSLSTHFDEVVREHALELQINVAALHRIHGSFRIHVARLLFGTHWAPTNLSDASLMLHHADITLTSRLYVGRSSAQSTLEATSGERAGSKGSEQKSEISFLRTALQAAEARAIAAEQRAAEQSAHLSELVAKITQGMGGPNIAA